MLRVMNVKQYLLAAKLAFVAAMVAVCVISLETDVFPFPVESVGTVLTVFKKQWSRKKISAAKRKMEWFEATLLGSHKSVESRRCVL